MSWDKNTVVCSEIDTMIQLLEEFKLPYTVKVLGKVEGNGLNDDYYINDVESSKVYPIRQLNYGNKVVMEQMVRHPDCDVNDIIISKKFYKTKLPKKWKIEVMSKDE